MSIRTAISWLLSMGSRRQRVALQDEAQLVDWPLPDPFPFATAPPKLQPILARGTSTLGISLFAYPFEEPEIAEFVREA